MKKRTLFEVKREGLDKKAKKECSDEVRKHRRDYWEVKRELEARSVMIERYAFDLRCYECLETNFISAEDSSYCRINSLLH